MKRNKDWQKFEDYIAEELKVVDKNATHTKGSRYGDLKVKGLHVECKSYDAKNVYQEDHMKKCIEEVPFHSDKIPLLITKNKDNNIRVHMEWLDFLNLYVEYHQLKYGAKNG